MLLKRQRSALVCGVIALFLLPVAPRAEAKAALAQKETIAPLCAQSTHFWRRFLFPRPRRYCKLLFQAQASLSSQPKRAALYAQEAIKETKRPIAARLVLAQAELALGNSQTAHSIFQAELEQSGISLAHEFFSVFILVSSARAAILEADYVFALKQYKKVSLHLDEIKSPHEQGRILIETATVLSYVFPNKGSEARMYLRAAGRKNAPLLKEVLAGALALAFLREGKAQEANQVATQLGSSWKLGWVFSQHAQARDANSAPLPVFPQGEKNALLAAVAQQTEDDEALDHWRLFVRQGGRALPVHLLRTVPQAALSPVSTP